MNNKLVKLTTQDVSNAIPVTNSLIIAEKIGYKHFRLTSLIKNHLNDFKEFGAITFEKRLLNSKNVDVAFLNENQFYLLVTYLRTTKKNKKVLELKKEMVRQFILMKKELQARVETRALSKNMRKDLTDTIKNCVTDESNFKRFAYSNYSKLVYKKILGKTVKKTKEERNIPKNKRLRDYLTIEELEKVQDLESKIATFIEFTDNSDKTDKEIYADVKSYLEGSIK